MYPRVMATRYLIKKVHEEYASVCLSICLIVSVYQYVYLSECVSVSVCLSVSACLFV